MYGGDGMDPVSMEGSHGEPLQLHRLLTFIQYVLSSSTLALYLRYNCACPRTCSCDK